MWGMEVKLSNQEIISPFYRVLVVGNGLCAAVALKALSEVGLSCTYARVAKLPGAMYGVKTPQNLLQYVGGAETPEAEWTTVVLDVAPLLKREGIFFRFEHEGLAQNVFGSVVFAFGASMDQDPKKTPFGVTLYEQGDYFGSSERVAWILDAGVGSHAEAGLKAVAEALEHREAGGKSYVFFRNIPVATRGGELLYDQAKRTGVCFIRYGKDGEPIVEPNGHAFLVRVKDTIAGESIDVYCDRIYSVGLPDPAAIPEIIKDVANHDTDRNGFLLSESIHCGLGQSFSRGVFAIGGCTGNLGPEQMVSQAYSVAVKARAWALRSSRMASVETISVNDECVRCLTCFRICPHSAISVNYAAARSKIASVSASCEQCGLCISECPREALDLIGFPQMGIEGFLDDIRRGSGSMFVVYGCERSTSDSVAKIDMPDGTIFLAVPCAGRISESMLWATLTAGVSGVLAVGCHPGNCASRNGTNWAGNRVKEILRKLRESGIEAPLVSYATVSARQTQRLETMVNNFKKSLDQRKEALLLRDEIGQ